MCRYLSGERGQSGAAGRGTEPQAEQPAAAGGVAEHSGSPHQSHRAAVQRQQALLAAPLHAQTHKSAERKMQIVQRACMLSIQRLFVNICKSRHIHTCILFNLCISTVSALNPGPAGW